MVARKKRRAKTVVTVINSKVVRRTNRKPFPGEQYVVLYARRPGGPLLKYTTGGKLAIRGVARYFADGPSADLAGKILKETFNDELKHYRMFAK